MTATLEQLVDRYNALVDALQRGELLDAEVDRNLDQQERVEQRLRAAAARVGLVPVYRVTRPWVVLEQAVGQ